jgi:hypothetical protein
MRQDDAKDAALAFSALELDAAAMRLDSPPCDGQSQAGAAPIA